MKWTKHKNLWGEPLWKSEGYTIVKITTGDVILWYPYNHRATQHLSVLTAKLAAWRHWRIQP